MDILVTTISITLAVIPSVIMRYILFIRIITKKQRQKLFLSYFICFAIQNIALFLILNIIAADISPLLYKFTIMIFGTFFFLINCYTIRGMFFQHIFVMSMQGSYSLVIHAIVSIILSNFPLVIPTHRRLILQSFIYIALFAISAYPLWRIVKNSFILKFSKEYKYYWNIVWLIPALLFINLVITVDDTWISTWRQLAVRLLTGAIIIVSWRCVNLDFKELEEKFSLESANRLLNIQMESISQQAGTIMENYEKIRILRHDMRHNVQMLSSLIHNGEYEPASLLLEQLNSNLKATRPIAFCNNPVINSSLLVYISRAHEENIEILSEIDIPENIPWNCNDIAILFANVLENAINASQLQPEGKKEIQIATRYADKKLAILVKNRFDGNILFGAEGMPVSEESGHGVGMSSITTIVSRYHAHMVCSHENGWFTISLVFSEYFINKS